MFVRLWGPPLALMAAIFLASSLPTVPRLPGDPANYVPHFGAYAVLAALVLRAVVRASWVAVNASAAVRSWIVAAGYGATDEIHQRFVPGRYPAVDDWVADALGALVAVLLAIAFARRRRRPGAPPVR